jgi:Zn-dependent peptidase ImmA (M78 family)
MKKYNLTIIFKKFKKGDKRCGFYKFINKDNNCSITMDTRIDEINQLHVLYHELTHFTIDLASERNQGFRLDNRKRSRGIIKPKSWEIVCNKVADSCRDIIAKYFKLLK